MAVVRTVLARKGLIQPQHGLTAYEIDQDTNWALLDANVAFVSDLQYRDLGLNGVVSGFALSVASTLTPGLTTGILYAQGSRYAPQIAPSLNPAPASATSYLFWNSVSGFYYQTSAAGATAGDALVGQVVTNATAVAAVIQATKIYGRLTIASSSGGPFTSPHVLGRVPLGAVIQMTSSGSIWFQPAISFDDINLYLASSGAGVTAQVQVW